MNFLYELGVSDFVQKLNLSRKSLNVYWDAARIELTQPCITTLFFIRLAIVDVGCIADIYVAI